MIVEPPLKLVGLSASQTGPLKFEQAVVPRQWLLAGPAENVMNSGIGAESGGLQTSTLAAGLADAAIGFLERESQQRPDLADVGRSLRSQWLRLRDDLLQAAAGAGVCSNEQLRTREQPGPARYAIGTGRRQRCRLCRGTSCRTMVSRGTFLPGVELSAGRVAGRHVRIGGHQFLKEPFPMSDEVHVTWHEHHVARHEREALNGHRGCVVWFTGLSGSGKSTVANVVDHKLHQLGVHSFLLDGDNIRHGLNASPERLAAYGASYALRFGLGFSAEDRQENIRRIGAVAELFASAGLVTLTAFVSPYRRDREAVRRQVDQRGIVGDFVEVYVDAPIEVCELRDPKGLYRKAAPAN